MTRLAAAIAAVVVVAGCGGRTEFLGATLPGSCRERLRDANDAGDRCVGWVVDRLAVVARDDEYDDPAVQAYVTGVAARVARANHLAMPTVRVTDRGNAPASAQPGGYVYVDREMLAALSSEAELAGVIAHEIAHGVAGHTSDLLDAFPPAIDGDLQQQRSRDDEATADELAVGYIARAGYSPDAMRTALLALERASQDGVVRAAVEIVDEVVADMKRDGSWEHRAEPWPDPDAVSGAGERVVPERERIIDDRHRYPREIDASDPTHPPMAERLARVAVVIAGRTDGEVGASRYRAHMTGLIVGPDPRRGSLVGSSWSIARLGLAVDLPATWHMDADAARLDASTTELEVTLWSIGKAWGDGVIDTLSEVRRTTVAGRPAVIGTAVDPKLSTRRSDLEIAMDAPRPAAGSAVAVITSGERALAIYVHGTDPHRQLSELLAHVRAMTAPERAAVVPSRLVYVTATEAGTAAQLQAAMCALPAEARWLEAQDRLVSVGSVVKCVAK